MSKKEQEYGPLGPGHAPRKDPLQGLRGVMAGTLVMEAIALLLVLTVIARVNDGAAWTPGRIWFVVVISLVMLVHGFLQRTALALPINLILQVIAIIGGFFVHSSMVAMAVIFGFVWIYIMVLRRNIKERMARGLLPSQHD